LPEKNQASFTELMIDDRGVVPIINPQSSFINFFYGNAGMVGSEPRSPASG
jgi:hypothetical protein